MSKEKSVGLIEQRQVVLYESSMTAVRAEDGHIYVVLRHMCEALGLNAQGQTKRAQRSHVLNEGLIWVDILSTQGENTQRRRARVLRVDLVPLWLTGVSTKAVKADVRTKLEIFQKQAARVLWEAFQEGQLTVDGDNFDELLATADPTIVNAYQMAQAMVRLARQQIIIDARLQQTEQELVQHSERLDALEEKLSEDATVSDAQAAQLSQAVKAVALVLGQQTKRNEFPGVYGELYRRYDCSSYKLLKKKDFDSAMAWLNEWKGSLESDTF